MRITIPHRLSGHSLYRAWQCMRLRCVNPKHPAYPRYGGRGITVCDRWMNDLPAFIADMGPKPTPRHELDRIDNDRGYEPGNCRWATRKENSRNRCSNRKVEFRGERRVLSDWCERLNLPVDTIAKRLDSGWSVARALTIPVRAKLPNGLSPRYVPTVGARRC